MLDIFASMGVWVYLVDNTTNTQQQQERAWLEGNATGTMWYMVAGVLAYVAVASLLQPVAVARLIYGPSRVSSDRSSDRHS